MLVPEQQEATARGEKEDPNFDVDGANTEQGRPISIGQQFAPLNYLLFKSPVQLQSCFS